MIQLEKLITTNLSEAGKTEINVELIEGLIARINHLETVTKVPAQARTFFMLKSTTEWQDKKAKQQAEQVYKAFIGKATKAANQYAHDNKFLLSKTEFEKGLKKVFNDGLADVIASYPLPCVKTQKVFTDKYGVDGMKLKPAPTNAWEDPQDPRNQIALMQLIDKLRADMTRVENHMKVCLVDGDGRSTQETRDRMLRASYLRLQDIVMHLTIALGENLKNAKKSQSKKEKK